MKKQIKKASKESGVDNEENGRESEKEGCQTEGKKKICEMNK